MTERRKATVSKRFGEVRTHQRQAAILTGEGCRKFGGSDRGSPGPSGYNRTGDMQYSKGPGKEGGFR